MVAMACVEAGLGPGELERRPLGGGVPHVVPQELKGPLSQEWLRCVDAVLDSARATTAPTGVRWLASMWGLAIAARRLGLRPVTTRFCLTNHEATASPAEGSRSDACIVHYCHGDALFDKRWYADERKARQVWTLPAGGAGVSGLVRSQLAAAGEFYGLRSAPTA